MADLKNAMVRTSLNVVGKATLNSDVLIRGKLTVNGETTTINTQTVSSKDQLIELGSGRPDALTSPAGFYVNNVTGSGDTVAIAIDTYGNGRIGRVRLSNGLIDESVSDLKHIAIYDEEEITPDYIAAWAEGSNGLRLISVDPSAISGGGGGSGITINSAEYSKHYLLGYNNSAGTTTGTLYAFDGMEGGEFFFNTDLGWFQTNSFNTVTLAVGDIYGENGNMALLQTIEEDAQGDEQFPRSVLNISSGAFNPNFHVKMKNLIVTEKIDGTVSYAEKAEKIAMNTSSYGVYPVVLSDSSDTTTNAGLLTSTVKLDTSSKTLIFGDAEIASAASGSNTKLRSASLVMRDYDPSFYDKNIEISTASGILLRYDADRGSNVGSFLDHYWNEATSTSIRLYHTETDASTSATNTIAHTEIRAGDITTDSLFANNIYTKSEVDLRHKPVEVTSTDGINYTATVSYITETSYDALKGLKLVIIPNMTSTSASSVTLNLNGLGAKGIKRWDNLVTSEWWSFTSANWFKQGYPLTVTFNGTYWMIEGMNKPYASDLQGSVAIGKGGTGATTAAAARTNLSVYSKAEVDSAIAAAITQVLNEDV